MGLEAAFCGGLKMTKILLIGDLHCGSRVGLMPPEVRVVEEDGEVETHKQTSEIQRILWRKFMECVKDVGRVDITLVNGDVVDGYGVKDKGAEQWNTDINTQVETACECLSQIRSKRFVITQGTPYHTSANPSGDEMVANHLRKSGDSEVIFGTDAILRVNGLRLHCSHKIGISSSAWMYRTTPVAKELVMALLNAQELGRIDGVIRSHAHYFVEVKFGHTFGMILPCWQARTPHMAKFGLAFVPRNGYVVLNVSSDGRMEYDYEMFSLKSRMPEVIVGEKRKRGTKDERKEEKNKQ